MRKEKVEGEGGLVCTIIAVEKKPYSLRELHILMKMPFDKHGF